MKLDNSSDHSVCDGSENKPSAIFKNIPIDLGNASNIAINFNFQQATDNHWQLAIYVAIDNVITDCIPCWQC